MNEIVSSGTKRPRVLNCKRRECLRLFENGCGYKKTAKETGLNAYTVREYLRRYRNGDFSGLREGRIARLQLNIKLEAIAGVCETSDN